MNKNIWVILITIGLAVSSYALIFSTDTIYQSIQKSYKAAVKKDLKYKMKSTEYVEFKILLDNHWKQSIIVSTIEDVFYPVRKWQFNPKQAVIKNVRDSQELNQMVSIKNNEKATKVRAKKAYFWAKRRNFKDEKYNNDFKEKLSQWQSNLLALIERQVNIKNASYNTVPYISVVFCACLLILFALFKRSLIASLVVSSLVMLSLVIGSNKVFANNAIPFHWIFLVVILVLMSNLRKKAAHHKSLFKVISVALPLMIGSTSAIGALIGGGLMVGVWVMPKLGPILKHIVCIHPLGLAFFLQSQDYRKSRLIVTVLILVVFMVAINQMVVNILFTSPIIYYGNIGVIITSAILLLINGLIIDENKDVELKRYSVMALIIGMVIYGGSQVIMPNISLWAFSFIWHPIIMWLSILLIGSMCQFKND